MVYKDYTLVDHSSLYLVFADDSKNQIICYQVTTVTVFLFELFS